VSDVNNPQINNPLDRPWEDVTISLVYREGNRSQTRDIHVVRAEVEASDREKYLAQAKATGDPQAIEAAEDFELTHEVFQQRVMTNVEALVRSPLYLEGKEPHQFRVLPPWAVLGVVVAVNNVAPRIVRA